MEIVLPNYISDGPGYCGALTFEFVDSALRLTFGTEVRTFNLPMKTLEVNGSTDLTSGQAQYAFSCLEVADQEYLGSAESLSTDRCRILSFADGAQGFLLVHGEPQLVTLGIGNKSYSLSAEHPLT